MKTRPILFTGPMVRAILAGRKVQTRRAAKAVKYPDWGNLYEASVLAREPQHVIDRACPYGKPRDLLWVRETWYCDSDEVQKGPYLETPDAKELTVYQATNPRPFEQEEGPGFWRPSIHMPRWASRITLEIVSIRVERLQDISEEDAWAEGCKRGLPTDNGGYFPAEEPDPKGQCMLGWDSPKDWFADLWDSINGPGSWDANPYVWRVEFRRVKP